MLVYELQQLIISKLKPGVSLKSVYDAAIAHATEKKKEVVDALPNNFGYGVATLSCFLSSDFLFFSDRTRIQRVKPHDQRKE